MITLRKASERGYAHHDWLESWHSFSFADYHDPAHVCFASLRVINDDIIQPDKGFDMHPHCDMEILTYILDGALRHQDSMGNGEEICCGEVQLMSAGSGIMHSEFNASAIQQVHLLQIWLIPSQQGLMPCYQKMHFSTGAKLGRWCLLASPDQADSSLRIHQDARIFVAKLDGTETLSYPITVNRKIYLHIACGTITANGQTLASGDALMFSHETLVALENASNAEVLLFDLG